MENIYLQMGIAGGFAVFSFTLFKEFLKFLKEEREQRGKIMDKATDAIGGLTREITQLREIIIKALEDMK